MYRESRHLGKIPGPIPRPYISTSAARVRNASVGAGASGGQSRNVQSRRYNKPAGCSTSVACRGRPCKQTRDVTVESSWNVMAHGDAREREWRVNWQMEWVASTLHTTLEHDVSALLPLMRTLRLPVVEWTVAPADLNGLVRFAERRNLGSARVPSHFKRSLLR
jgi:hypothetical protein